MKTKNIFRMLLVAVTLLLGANNVKAEEVWSNSFSETTTIPASAFSNAKKGTIIRVNVTDVNQWSWQIEFSFSNNATPDFTDFDGITSWGSTWAYQNSGLISGNHFDLICSQNTIAGLNECGLTIKPTNMTVSSISLEEGSTVAKTEPTLEFSQSSFIVNFGDDFTEPTLTNESNVAVTYSSSNNNIVTVDQETGEVTIIAVGGPVTITATSAETDEFAANSASYTITVNKGTPTLSFPEEEYTATIGQEFTPPTLNNPDNVSVYYYMNNTYPAEVNRETGAITLKNEGETEVYVKFDGDDNWNSAQASYKLIVIKPEKQTPTLSFPEAEYTAVIGEEFTPPTLNNPDNVSVYYQIDNQYPAEVNRETGAITLKNEGETVVYAKFDGDDNWNSAQASYKLIVRSGEATTKARLNMSFNPSSVVLTLGEEFTAPTLSIKNAEGNDVTGLTITYSSSNENLATIATDGTVTLIENVTGSTTITATFMGDNTYEAASAQYTITVNNPVAPSFTITISPTTNGTVTAEPESAVEGTLVTLTISPSSGYELDAISVKDVYDTDVQVNMTDYTFSMPASNVTVTATFKQTGSGPVEPTIPEDIENEHRLWTGPESAEGSDGHVSNLTANLFADIKTGDSFRVYVSDINNDQNWKLYITDNVNGWNSQVFEGFTGGDILRNNGGSAYYHAEDGYGYFEFTCTDQSVANFKNNGTQMSFQWMTITKVTYISNNTTPTQKTRFSFSFNQSYIYVTYGVDTFTGQYPSANKQLGDEVWNHLSWESSNTNVAEVNNEGVVTIKGLGTTHITVSFAGNDNYYPATESYTLIVQPNVRTANIGTSGYATFSSDAALDFYGITSLRAYIAKSIDANWVVLQQVTGTVAANTGLVIVGTTTDIPVADSGSSYSDNLLVPGTGASVGGAGIYVLTNESGSVKFADTSAHSATVPVGKAYLQAPGTSAARLNIRWEGDATGIKALKSDFNSDDAIYDLNGQRVIKPSKGLYIINGKKVVIK